MASCHSGRVLVSLCSGSCFTGSFGLLLSVIRSLLPIVALYTPHLTTQQCSTYLGCSRASGVRVHCKFSDTLYMLAGFIFWLVHLASSVYIFFQSPAAQLLQVHIQNPFLHVFLIIYCLPQQAFPKTDLNPLGHYISANISRHPRLVDNISSTLLSTNPHPNPVIRM